MNNKLLVKTVIFDLDGVIVDSEMVYLNRLKEFLMTINSQPTQKELFSLVGTNNKTTWNKISSWIDYKYDREIFKEKYDNYYKDKPLEYAKVKRAGIEELLLNLKSKNYKIGLASCSSIEEIETALYDCNIYHFFDKICSGHDFENSKPNPDIYLYVADELEVNYVDCLVIEDSDVGIEAGKRANMKVIAIKEERFGFSQDKADIIVDELSEINNYL